MIEGAGSLASRGSPPPGAAERTAHEGRPWRERALAWLKGTTRRQRVGFALALVVVAALVLGWSWIDVEAFNERAKAWPAWLVSVLVGVLPLAGFPVSALHLAAGLRFEFWPALLVVAGTTLFQHVAAWGLVHVLPDKVFARLVPWREKLAGAGHAEAAVLCSILPGMPYTVQMYLLPVMGVPLRVICLVSAPLHTARATVTILVGNLSDELTPGRVAALVLYYLTIFGACALTLRSMRRKLAARRGEEPGGAAA